MEKEHMARKAKGIKAPEQTTAERAEHELTLLPCGSSCPTCIQNKGRADNFQTQQMRSYPTSGTDFVLSDVQTTIQEFAKERHTCAADTPKLQIKVSSNMFFLSAEMRQCAWNITNTPISPSPILT